MWQNLLSYALGVQCHIRKNWDPASLETNTGLERAIEIDLDTMHSQNF